MTANPAQPAPEGRLRKELGLFDVYSISTGAMFSSGFFLLPGLAAAQTGPSVVLAYLVASLFILPAMFSKAELTTAMPKAGGTYYFLDRALGPLMGTVGGLGTWLALVLKSAFALVGMGAYLALYVDVPIEPLAIALTLVFMGINIVGAKESSGLQRILVTILLGVLLFFIIQGVVEVSSRGFDEVNENRFSPFFAFGFSEFMSTVGFVFVSYAGLTKVSSVAEEVRDPDRNIPWGMMLSLATTAVVYSVGVYILVAVLPAEELRADLTPVASAAQAFSPWLPGGAGVILIVVAAIAAFASTGNAGIMSASRYPLAMARDRLVSPLFGKLGRFQTPTFSIVVTALLIIASIVFLDVASIAKLASAFQLVLFSLVCLAVVIMRESGIEGYDPGFRSPLYPWMQILGVVAPLWLIAEMGEMAVLFTLLLTAVTIGWYLKYAARRVERTGAIFHTFARLGQNRHGGLDLELRAIVKEKGLRDEDPFDEVVARASIRDFAEPTTYEALVHEAAEAIGERSGLSASLLVDGLLDELDEDYLFVADSAALPHLRVAELDRPALFLVRCCNGLLPAGTERADLAGRLRDLRAVFFLASPESEPGQHLRLLGHLASHVDDPAFLVEWMAASSTTALRQTLLREERSITLYVARDRPTSVWVDRAIRDITLPEESLVALIRRKGRGIIPHGDDVLRDGDQLTVIGEPEAITELSETYGGS